VRSKSASRRRDAPPSPRSIDFSGEIPIRRSSKIYSGFSGRIAYITLPSASIDRTSPKFAPSPGLTLLARSPTTTQSCCLDHHHHFRRVIQIARLQRAHLAAKRFVIINHPAFQSDQVPRSIAPPPNHSSRAHPQAQASHSPASSRVLSSARFRRPTAKSRETFLFISRHRLLGLVRLQQAQRRTAAAHAPTHSKLCSALTTSACPRAVHVNRAAKVRAASRRSE